MSTMQPCRTAWISTLLIAFALPAQALTIEVAFDDTDDSTVTAPFVGSGSLTTSAASLADGFYVLAAIPDIALSFVFGSSSFSLGDLLTPSEVSVEIATSPLGRYFRFDSDEDGPNGGSADFENSMGDVLSFEPDFGGRYFVTSTDLDLFGNYGAPEASAAIPLPATGAALLTGLAGLAALRRRSKS